MTWNVFANVTQLNTPDLDTNFSNLAVKCIFPCTSSGTNAYTLSTAVGDPPVTSYTSRSQAFAFVAPAASTSSVTINVNGIGAKNLYKNNGAAQAGTGDIANGGIYYVAYDSTLNTGSGGFLLLNEGAASFGAITVQSFTAGSGTYTPTGGTVRINCRMAAGGGGGGAQTTNNGSNGNDSSFGTWTCIHGQGGTLGSDSAGGAGGTGGVNGTGTLIVRWAGQPGSTGSHNATHGYGGLGGNTPFGGGGTMGTDNTTGLNANANTGSGGGGANGGSGIPAGAGGGAGEYIEFWVFSPSSVSYSVGTGGNGGAAGVKAGGNGAGGILIISEYPY